MPVVQVTPYMMKPGYYVRAGDHLSMVESCKFCNKPESIFYRKWISKMRAPTEEEKIISYVMQT